MVEVIGLSFNIVWLLLQLGIDFTVLLVCLIFITVIGFFYSLVAQLESVLDY
jgi:hypothetical protein